MKFKSALAVFLSCAVLLLLVPAPAFAGTYTITLVSGDPLVMGDSKASLSFRISNTGATGNIEQVRLDVDAATYYVSESTTAPPGWTVTIKNAGAGQSYAEFSDDGDVVAPGESLVFTMIITGAGDANFLAAASDQTDTLYNVTVSGTEGFARSGGIPTWQRVGLKATLGASPPSLGTGGVITLQMQVINRSTSGQSLITAAAPNLSGTGNASLLSGPGYLTTLLSGDHDDAVTTMNVASTLGFPATGTIRIDSEEITYNGTTGTSFTGCTRGANSTTPAAHAGAALVMSLDVGSMTLASGSAGVITWTYAATSTGTMTFSSSAGNGTVSSPTVQSNEVIIGSFTAILTVTPLAVISGQSVTVRMTAYNNGATTLANVTPSGLTFYGGATNSLVSGPLPKKLAFLGAGQSGIFEWVYTISGATGETYRFEGYAAADDTNPTDTATTEQGVITSYTVKVSPDQVVGGSTNVTLAFTVTNNGGYSLEGVYIVLPGDEVPPAGIDWVYSSASGGYNGNWKIQTGGSPTTVKFSANNPGQRIPVGGAADFFLVFSSVQSPLSDTPYNFAVTLEDTSGFQFTIEEEILVTTQQVAVAAVPDTGLSANGFSTSVITATVTSGGSPEAGVVVTFDTSAGTLSSSTAVTNASGEAVVTLTAPISSIDIVATVTATYLSAYDTVDVSFTGVTGANILYVGDTLSRGGTDPRTVFIGETGVTFTLDATNVGTAAVTLSSGSYFTFTDGTKTFTAYLDTATFIAVDGTGTLSFGSPTNAGGGGGVDVDPLFTPGTYTPSLHITSGAWTQSPDQDVIDSLIVGGAAINIIRWREL